jgi:hypothetical protein
MPPTPTSWSFSGKLSSLSLIYFSWQIIIIEDWNFACKEKHKAKKFIPPMKTTFGAIF